MSRQGSVHSFTAEPMQIHHASEPADVQGTDSADIAEQSVRPKRTIKPIQKLRENYEYTRDKFSSKLSDFWDRTSHCMSVLPHFNDQPAELADSIVRLSAAYEQYQRLSARYTAFLQDCKIEDSSAELTKTDALNQQRALLVQNAQCKAELHIAQLQETRSHRSISTKHTARSSRSSRSRSSTLSDKLIEARADAESKKAQSSLAKKEAEMESQIKILQIEKEEAGALARLKVLEQAMGQSTNSDCLIPAELEDPIDRTSEYVLKHNVYKDRVISCTSY